MRYLLVIAIALVLGVWYWRKNYQPSVLEQHYATLEAKAKNGVLSQLAAYASYPVTAMRGQSWGTTFILNPTNLACNKPGPTQFNLRFPQPTNPGYTQSNS
jgi:hypothetical protein